MGTDCSTCCTTKGEANNEINDTTGASDADSRFGTRSKPTTQKNVSGKAADDSKTKGGVSFLCLSSYNLTEKIENGPGYAHMQSVSED